MVIVSCMNLRNVFLILAKEGTTCLPTPKYAHVKSRAMEIVDNMNSGQSAEFRQLQIPLSR